MELSRRRERKRPLAERIATAKTSVASAALVNLLPPTMTAASEKVDAGPDVDALADIVEVVKVQTEAESDPEFLAEAQPLPTAHQTSGTYPCLRFQCGVSAALMGLDLSIC